MSLLWTLVYLINISSYQNLSYDSTQNGHKTLFQISRRVGSGKHITDAKFMATHNPNTGIYHFDDKRFVSLNDMLYYVLYF